jgi:hypothetical protein
MTYLTPVTVVDNFFEDPLAVREFALKQKYESDPENLWPGERSAPLHELNLNLFKSTIERYLALFHTTGQIRGWHGKAHFQRVSSKAEKGWIHRDPNLISGVIYLSPNASLDSGTTIYQPKDLSYNDPDPDNKLILPASVRDEHNSHFDESVVVKNKFNRLIAFDGHLWHGVNSFQDEERLTLVFFIEALGVDHYSLQRMNRR